MNVMDCWSTVLLTPQDEDSMLEFINSLQE